jgi:ankyrin repeat protein
MFQEDWKPLHIACWGGHNQAVSLLLQSHAEINCFEVVSDLQNKILH